MVDYVVQEEQDSRYISVLKSWNTRCETAFNMMKSLRILLQGTNQSEAKTVRNHPTEETKRIFAGFVSTCPQVATDVLEKAFIISRICLMKKWQAHYN